jgi:hypothetical protein
MQKFKLGLLRQERKKKLAEFERSLSSLKLLPEVPVYLELEESYQLNEQRWDPSILRYVSKEMMDTQFKIFLSEIEKVLRPEPVWIFFDHYPWVGGLEFEMGAFFKEAIQLAQFDLSGIKVLKQGDLSKKTGMLVDINFEDSPSQAFYQLYVWGDWATPCAHLLHPEKRDF